MYPKFYIGPMSKNIVDSIIEFANEHNRKIGLIPSRRQIEFDGGYVNNWETEDFSLYVRSKTKNIILQRDHAGPNQGSLEDNGFDSLRKDTWNFDLIHVDPWKKFPEYKDGLRETADMIAYASALNPNLRFEVGTEESIRKFEVDELNEFLIDLEFYLGKEIFKKIIYLVIQSGTALKETYQVGTYDKKRLIKMIELCKDHKIMSKEHNGDYISINQMKEKFSLGLDAINIAPEFGLIETKTYLKHVNKDQFEIWYQLCLESKKWEKWVNKSFKPEENTSKLIEICGHYLFSNQDFIKNIKSKLHKDIDNEVKSNIKIKLNELYVW